MTLLVLFGAAGGGGGGSTGAGGSIATYTLAVDWDNNGTFATSSGEDVTSQLFEVHYNRGRDYASQLTGRSVAGKLTAVLDNSDGRFNSFNTSGPLYGNLLPGRRVQLRTLAPGSYTLWTGYLETIMPEPRHGGIDLAHLTAYGPLGLINQKETEVARQTNVPTGTAIGAILDDAGWSATGRDIDAGNTTMTRWWADKQSALAALRDVENTELGFIRESADGKIVFESRTARLVAPYTNSQAVFSDAAGAVIAYQEIQQAEPLREVYNRMEASVQRYTVGGSAVLWTLSESGVNSPAIAAGASVTYWASYPTPDSATQADSVDAWTTPVATTDYLANSAADGSGADLTGSVTVVVDKFARSMKVTLTNGSASTAYITFLQARGTPVTRDDPVGIVSEDATSQTAYGKRTYPLTGKFIPNTVEAKNNVDYLLSVYKAPTPVLTVTILANRNDDSLVQALAREVSDRVTITANNDAGLGIDGDFFVERIDASIYRNNIHTAQFACSAVLGTPGGSAGGSSATSTSSSTGTGGGGGGGGSFWVLDTSELDLTTRLGY